MVYKITQKVIDLVEELFAEGYEGTAEITNSYCTGTKGVLGESVSVVLYGFCKETLHLVGDTDTNEVLFVGRYSEEYRSKTPAVGDIVKIAWEMQESYGGEGHSMPSEFEKLFLKYGYMKEEIVVKKVYKKIR